MCGSSGPSVGVVLGSLPASRLGSQLTSEKYDLFLKPGVALLPALLSLRSYTIQDHLSRCGTSHSGLGPPSSLTNQENAAQICLQANWKEAHP